jgi:hypothetical protein
MPTSVTWAWRSQASNGRYARPRVEDGCSAGGQIGHADLRHVVAARAWHRLRPRCRTIADDGQRLLTRNVAPVAQPGGREHPADARRQVPDADAPIVQIGRRVKLLPDHPGRIDRHRAHAAYPLGKAGDRGQPAGGGIQPAGRQSHSAGGGLRGWECPCRGLQANWAVLSLRRQAAGVALTPGRSLRDVRHVARAQAARVRRDGWLVRHPSDRCRRRA